MPSTEHSVCKCHSVTRTICQTNASVHTTNPSAAHRTRKRQSGRSGRSKIVEKMDKPMQRLDEENKNRTRSRSRSKSKSRGDQCWYHHKFGEKANKCIQPCNFQKKGHEGAAVACRASRGLFIVHNASKTHFLIDTGADIKSVH